VLDLNALVIRKRKVFMFSSMCNLNVLYAVKRRTEIQSSPGTVLPKVSDFVVGLQRTRPEKK